LTPSTTYYFRASATNAGGMANGSTLSFTTRGISDTALVFTDSALNITTTTATLKGIANARGLSVTSVFIHYSSDRALLEAGSGINATVTPNTINGTLFNSFSANVSGLTPNTTYYYRASATNLWSTVRGIIRSFTTSTPIQAPSVLTLPATDIGLNTAVLYGSVNPNGSQTSLITLKYSTIKADVDAGNGLSPIVNPTSISGFIPTLITANLTGLQPNTTYFYRASATTPGGVRNGATLSFTTISSADILVPSAFSPNGDGQNDILVPIALGIRSLSYFKIMNRWGQLVFETKELGKGWDGNFKGVPQPRDTYSWVIEALDVTGKVIRKSGGVLIMR
jgi:gliding motility-associated-like protein